MHVAPRGYSGFTLVETLIAVAFVVVLLAMAVPAAGSIRDERQAGAVVELTEELEAACRAFREDTDRRAVEFSATPDGEAYAQARYHTLSMRQNMKGWHGPYRRRPITHEDNPWGQAIYLQSHLAASPANGFDLDADGAVDAEGPGQFVVLYGVPERVARIVDGRLDRDLGIEGEGWRRTGRVEWMPSSGGALTIQLQAEGTGGRK